MIDRIVAFVALLALIVFLGVLVWRVPELDLTLVIVLTVVLAVVDLYLAAFRRNKKDDSTGPR